MEEVKKISFRQKNTTTCPICKNEFYREEMFTGSGRLIAEKLTDELRRIYKESQKYGRVQPLVYMLTVCPNCFFSAYPKDFKELTDDEVSKLQEARQARKNAVMKFFGELDFKQDRDVRLGAASFMLAVDCYNLRNKKVAPTFKKGVSSVRAAWLFSDMIEEYPDMPYKKMSLFFYRKAYEYYTKILDLLQNGAEPADAAGHMGPDSDKNWGYEGILYLSAILTVKYGITEKEMDKRIEKILISKKYLSRVFGMGRSSKSTPTELLNKTRILYEKINEILEKYGAEKEE